MRTQTEDRQLTRDQYLRNNLLVFASFEICAGMNGVFACPSCWGEQRVQPVGVGPLIGIWDVLSTCRLLTFSGVHHSLFDLRALTLHYLSDPLLFRSHRLNLSHTQYILH